MALLVWKLARELAPGSGRADAGAAPPAGMPRPLFMTLAEREFARARRYGTGAALVLVDIDRYAPPLRSARPGRRRRRAGAGCSA